MAQAFLITSPRFRVFDANGAPGAGFKLYTYASGTSTPKVTYSQSDQGAQNTQPVVMDASGECDLWLPEGELYRFTLTDAADVTIYTRDGIEAITAPAAAPAPPDPVPTGAVLFFAGSAAPSGWLIADGSAVSRATYAALFAVVASTYGSGDGSTTFNLPSLVQRFALGKAASGTGATLGETGGAIDHTHSGPSHTHTASLPRDGWGDTLALPSISGRLNVGEATGVGQFNSSYQPTGDKAITSDAGGTGATGTQNPAYLTLLGIVKT